MFGAVVPLQNWSGGCTGHVPLYHQTGLCCGAVVGRLWAGCTSYCLLPVVPVLIVVVPLLCYSAHNGQIRGDLFKGVFFPNGSPSLELVLPPLFTFFELANSHSLHGFLLVFEEKREEI